MPGGKQKQALRTKGNVQPSSSGRAAELLAASHGGKLGFVGFQTMTDLGYVPVTDDVDGCVDGDFRMLLRKFSKKDAVTKLKTLLEFQALCKEKDEETLNGVLTFWPRLYNKLSMDSDRRVREASQHALQALVVPIRRSLAPYLKSIMASWLLSQCDPYAPSADAARGAFSAVFPANKQPDVLLHCKTEIFNAIKDSLLVQTVASLTDGSTTPKEEAELKYIRLVSSSLTAVRHMITAVSSESKPNFLDEHLHELMTDAKFWKLSKQPSNQIRASFYALLTVLCMKKADVSAGYADRLCPCVLHRLDESDPLVCPNLWEAVVAVISSIESCWQHVNVRKACIPQLWNVLNHDGHGSAKFIYPVLLPLLSKLPHDVTTPEFHDEFFQKLACERQRMVSDVTVIVTAYMECLRYVIVAYVNNGDVTAASLLQARLMAVLETSMTDISPHLATSPLHPQLAHLLNYIRKQDTPNWRAAHALFWQQFSASCHKWLDASPVTVNRLEDLMVNLKRQRREKHIAFTDTDAKADDNEDCDSNADSFCLALVSELCVEAFQLAKSRRSWSHIGFLARIVSTYRSAELVAGLGAEGDHDVCLTFCRETLIPWIRDLCHQSNPDHREGLKGLLDLLVSVHGLATTDIKIRILESITEELSEAGRLYEVITAFLPQRQDASVHHWFNGDKLGQLLVRTTQQLCTVSLGCTSPLSTDSTNVQYRVSASTTDSSIAVPAHITSVTVNSCSDVLEAPVDVAVYPSEITDRGDVIADNKTVIKAEEYNGGEQAAVCEVVPDEINTRCDGAVRLLRLALTIDNNLGPLIQKDYVNQILSCLTATLVPPPAYDDNAVGHFPPHAAVDVVCDLAGHFYANPSPLTHAGDTLLLQLFRLSLVPNAFDDALANKIRATWLMGVSSNQKGAYKHDAGFLAEAVAHIKSLLSQSLSWRVINHIVLESSRLLSCVHQSVVSDEHQRPPLDTPDVLDLIKALHQPANFNNFSWEISVLYEGVLPLDVVHPPTDASQPITSRYDLVPAPVSSVIGYIRLVTSLAGDDDNACVDVIGDECLMELMLAVTYMKAVVGRRREYLRTTDLGQAYQYVRTDAKRLLSAMNDDKLSRLQHAAFQRSLTDGALYALCLADLLTLHAADMTQLTKQVNMFEHDLSVMQTMVIAVPHMTKFAVIELAVRVVDDVTNLAPSPGTYSKIAVDLAVIRRCVLTLFTPCQDESIAQLDDLVISLLNTILQWTRQDESIFLLQSQSSWPFVCLHLELMRLLSVIVQSQRLLPVLSPVHWDFILCRLVSWVQVTMGQLGYQFVVGGPRGQSAYSYQLTATHAQTLLRHTAVAMNTLVPAMEASDVIHPTLTQEWNEFFVGECYRDALANYIRIIDQMDMSQLTLSEEYLVRSLSESLVHCPSWCLTASSLPPRLSPDSHLADDMQTLLNYCCPLLTNASRCVQLTAFHLLHSVVQSLSKADDGYEVEGEDQMDEVDRSPPQAIISVLKSSAVQVEEFVHQLTPCEKVTLTAYSQAYTFTLAYLLSWKLTLAFFKGASSELRVQYANYLKRAGLIDLLMRHMTHILPENPVIPLKDVLTRQTSGAKLTSSRNLFSQAPQLDVAGDGSSVDIQHEACHVFYTALEDLPALIRQWLNNQSKTTAAFVDKYTSKHVSPILCHQEISAVSESAVTFENMVVKTRPAAREVAAVYTVDDVSMEIVVLLPANYPFGVVVVETGRRVGVATAQWRNWMLQMTTILNHQNGSILDGLTLWKRNIDKKFEGVEDCMICFSVIHGANCQLPKQLCRTCKKKFHSACLYKWFNTSNNTACPLCRNLF